MKILWLLLVLIWKFKSNHGITLMRKATGSAVKIDCTIRFSTSADVTWLVNDIKVADIKVTTDSSKRDQWRTYLYTSHIGVSDPTHPSKVGSRYESSSSLTISNLLYSVWLIATTGYCGGPTVVTVTDCSEYLPFGVTVQASTLTYRSKGQFSCINDGDLFYSNGNQLTGTDTTCLESAEWSKQNELQCWKAPDVSLEGNLTVKVGNTATFICKYYDVIPVGMSSLYYFDDVKYSKSKTEYFTTPPLEVSDNNKIITCQAWTSYVQLFSKTGKSPNYRLNVLYPPIQKKITHCMWFVNQPGWCNVTIESNLKPFFVSLTKGGSLVTSDSSDIIISSEGNAVYQFHRLQVLPTDNGMYNLTVSLSEFPNHYIMFDVIIEEGPSEILPLITVVCILILIGVVCGILYAIRIRRKTKLAEKTDSKDVEDHAEIEDDTDEEEDEEEEDYECDTSQIGVKEVKIEGQKISIKIANDYVTMSAISMKADAVEFNKSSAFEGLVSEQEGNTLPYNAYEEVTPIVFECETETSSELVTKTETNEMNNYLEPKPQLIQAAETFKTSTQTASDKFVEVDPESGYVNLDFKPKPNTK